MRKSDEKNVCRTDASKTDASNTVVCKIRTIEDDFYFIGCALFVFIGVFLSILQIRPEVINQIKPPPCLFHYLTGYYCPGCGGTRATAALLHGNLLASMRFHPIVVYAAAVYLAFMGSQTVERISCGRIRVGMRYHNRYVWAALLIIMINFIMKNILHYYCGYTM